MNLIGLGYRAQVGKDTVASFLGDEWQRFSFADPVRAVLKFMDPIIVRDIRLDSVLRGRNDWESAKTFPEVRRLLHALGVASRDEIHQGVWVGATMAKVDRHLKEGGKAVLTDVRFPNEVEAVAKRGGKVVLVNRPSAAVLPWTSDHALDGFEDWDYVIDNIGTLEELKAKAVDMVDAFGAVSVDADQ